MRRLFVLFAAALFTASCAGPRTPLDVSVKELPTDVLLGKKKTPPPPPPGVNLNPGFPVLIQPPAVVFNPRTGEFVAAPSVPAKACTPAHPFTAPTYEARTRATSPPVSGTYVFRNDGTYENVGTRRVTGSFPAQTQRTVKNVTRDSDGSFRFSIEEPLGDRTTTNTYDVTPESVLQGQAGVFLISTFTTFSSGGSDSFAPAGGIKLFEFPAEPGRQWDSVGTDPLSRTTMRFHARIGRDIPDSSDPDELPDLEAKARVDACGAVLDAWWIEVTAGEIISPEASLAFRALYAMAPQFGGFSVLDVVEVSGTSQGTTTKSKNQATISSEPAFPG